MTEAHSNELTILEANILQVMSLCENLSQQNGELKQRNQELERQNTELSHENKELHTKYEHLKMAKALAGTEVDLTAAKANVTQMVKDIDQCIALLNG
ncbi:hypothetical protein AGMMS49982_13930 [Bacteroidia bacterium]|nr:hypothetical protein AGMMS49982_13930 [Bacteroidia bacterium]